MKEQPLQRENRTRQKNQGEKFDYQIKKANSWEEVIKSHNCFFCQKNFTEKEIQEKNYQLTYAAIYGSMEIYHLYHQQHKEHYPNGIDCSICQKPVNNLIILDEVKRPYHPECFKLEKVIYHKKHTHPQITNLKIDHEKITAILEEGREISIYFTWLIKKWKWPQNINSEQLKNYQIDDRRFRVWFEIDKDRELDLTVFMFTHGTYLGPCGCCW